MKSLGFTFTVLVCVLAMAGSTPLLAQSPSFPDFSSNANLKTNGTAVVPTFNGAVNVLRLNPLDFSQDGSAWFKTLQPVAEGFSTTFTFQITPPPPPLEGPAPLPADGIAFVIQNSAAGIQALGQGGGAIGYGSFGDGAGIENSLAIEFDTWDNPWDEGFPNVDPANHVAVQSCGTGSNSPDHTAAAHCNFAIATAPVTLADGHTHTVQIEYTPAVPPPAQCGDSCNGTPASLQVTIDGTPVFSPPVEVDLSSLLTLASTGGELSPADSAYVGFTAATGAAEEVNDILSWTFTSHGTQSITQPLPAGVFTTFNFGSYLYKVRPDKGIDNLTVTEVPTDPGTFTTDRNNIGDFPNSQCIIYDHTGGKCIEFHAECQGANCNTVNYDVVTSYDVPTGTVISNPGFLKATGKLCQPGTKFDQNIITAFFQTRTDPTTKGSSKPSFSCFVATQGVQYGKADIDVLNLGPSKAKPGSVISYVATVIDFGPANGQGVTINNTIPSNTIYQSASLCTLSGGCSSMPCSSDGITASCSTPTLAKFGVEFMIVTVKVNANLGQIIDTVNVTSFNPDPDLKPDRSSTAVTNISTR